MERKSFENRRTTQRTALLLSALLFASQFVAVATQVSAEPVLLNANKLVALSPDLSPKVAAFALNSMRCAQAKLGEQPADKLAIIDYSRSSTERRFWLFDLTAPRLLVRDLVAHGRNSGANLARSFSNREGSLQSSLGLFRVGSSYFGKHGNSLRLIGLENGINDLAEQRAIVLHGADYVSDGFIRSHRRLGRSFGCPALGQEAAATVIKLFEHGGGYLFSYFPDKEWLSNSSLLASCVGM